MHVLAAVTAALVLTAQADAPPAPPPPPIADEDKLEEPPPPPPVEAKPATPESSPPKATQPAPEPGAAAEPDGMGSFSVFLAQWLVGCGTACGLFLLPCAVSIVPVVGGILSFGLNSLMCLIAGPLVGLVEVVVGDMFGKQRGTILWSILGGYGGYAAGALVGGIAAAIGTITSLALGGTALAGIFALLQESGGNPLAFLAALFATYAGVIAAVVISALVALVAIVALTALGPALVYLFTAENKLPGDGDFRFPGFTDPAHKEATEAFLPDLSGPKRAMAY